MLKKNYEVYLIEHRQSGMQYIGRSSNDYRIRFQEHIHGYGALTIYDLIQHGGATSDDFMLTKLASCSSNKDAAATESQFVKQYNTAYPNGLNAERATSTYKKYNHNRVEYLKSDWCLVLLRELMLNRWFPVKNTVIQDRIEKIAKNQTSIKALSVSEHAAYNRRHVQKYSIMEKIRTDGEVFREGRRKFKERVSAGVFTDLELESIENRSAAVKSIWANRTDDERKTLVSSGLNTMNTSKKQCNVCLHWFTRGNINRHHNKCIKTNEIKIST